MLKLLDHLDWQWFDACTVLKRKEKPVQQAFKIFSANLNRLGDCRLMFAYHAQTKVQLLNMLDVKFAAYQA